MPIPSNRLMSLALGIKGAVGLGSLPSGLYSAFANPVLERLGFGMANMRLISRDAAERNASRATGRLPNEPIGCASPSVRRMPRAQGRLTASLPLPNAYRLTIQSNFEAFVS
jgi:hypothetical protein